MQGALETKPPVLIYGIMDMNTGNKHLNCLCAALILIWVLSFGGIASAFAKTPFLPTAKIQIKALYGQGTVPGMGSDQTWTVQCLLDQNAVTWTYKRGDDALFCTVTADTGSQPAPFKLSDKQGRMLESSLGGMLPMADFAAPCQIFNLESLDKGGSFKIVRLAGGRRFLTSLTYTCETVDYETALENGWILADASGYDPEQGLVMVTLTNTSTKITLIRQLWQENADWWLYQETSIGQFWRQSGGMK